MPLQATSGAASYDAFGGGAAAVPNYIESCFSTYLYTSDGTTQTITNGIDLSTYGGMVWIKNRSAAQNHYLSTTTLGIQNTLTSNNTGGLGIGSDIVHSVTTTGFTAPYNFNIGENLASWTFRKQPKFFDVVTYTGDAVAGRTVAHNLGSVPGCIIVKKTSASGNNWVVYHRSLGATKYIYLNTTAAQGGPFNGFWNDTEPTSTVFSLGINNAVNEENATYVAYLFAHNAGGFGLTGTDNVISCGSFTTDGSGNATVSLGYEPQWVLIKSSSNADGWQMVDTMRGMAVSNGLYNGDQVLQSQASSAETSGAFVQPSATGFDITYYSSSRTYIYIAIRRGPMKVPTSGTSVFAPVTTTATNTNSRVISSFGFPLDLLIANGRSGSIDHYTMDRLRGATKNIYTSNTQAEGGTGAYGASSFASMTGYTQGTSDSSGWDSSTYTPFVFYGLKRAPSFFDEVCYTGTGSAITIPHNLTVKPELIIQKCRSTLDNWHTFTSLDGWARLNSANAWADTANGSGIDTIWQATTTTVALNSTFVPYFAVSASTYVLYLFATCPGVSKVGSYTGNGTTQTINCGFGAGGARFVLIKRSDDTGGWYVYDTARGMTALTDPYLFLHNTAGEVATLGSVTTVSTGFALDSTILAAINISGGSYIFLAIA